VTLTRLAAAGVLETTVQFVLVLMGRLWERNEGRGGVLTVA
jgi:hypothetical protein